MKNNILIKRAIPTLITLLTATVMNAQEITGSWTGRLDVGTVQLNLVFNISRNERGSLECTMDSPDQGAKGIPTEITLQDNKKVRITAAPIGVTYEGELEDGEIKGKFTQNGYGFTLNLKPGTVTPNRPQEPRPPFPYVTEEVTFTNTDDGAVLCGTLTYPTGFEKMKKGTVPAVVMVTGSGLQNRDEEVFGHKPFLVIADHLAKNGIASLRYDDRGTGKSKGDAINGTTQNNMKDALAAIEYVRNTGRFGRTGVLGHSEGGSIAFMLGAAGHADFIVSMAGPGVRGDSILTEQNMAALKLSGKPDKICTDYCKALKGVLAHIISNKGTEDAAGTVKGIISKTGADLPARAAQNLVKVMEGCSPWLKHFIGYDPEKDISDTKCPVMAINGSRDTQVAASTNLTAISRMLPDNKLNLIKEYDGLNHLFQHCTTGNIAEYGKIEETISPEVLHDITEWIQHLGR